MIACALLLLSAIAEGGEKLFLACVHPNNQFFQHAFRFERNLGLETKA